jgi:hypothetical protein
MNPLLKDGRVLFYPTGLSSSLNYGLTLILVQLIPRLAA